MNYPPYIDALGWTLLHSLWQGAVLALLYGLLRWCLRGQRPQLRYGLGLITLAALPIWAGLTLWQLWPTELAPLPTSQSSTEPLPTADIEALMPLLAQATATGEAGAHEGSKPKRVDCASLTPVIRKSKTSRRIDFGTDQPLIKGGCR